MKFTILLKQVLITVLFNSALLNCQLQINRVRTHNIPRKHFYYTKDYFTNPLKDKQFCDVRNSKCKTLQDCSECYCKNIRDTFLSYEQGCQSYSTSKRILNGM